MVFASQVSFDLITSFLYKLVAALAVSAAVGGQCDAQTRLAITFGAAALTSVLSCVASQPGDVILTETYKAHGGDASLTAISSRIYRERGMGGFFVGLKARLAHVGGIITSQLAIYDYVKQACGLAATGSH